MARVAWRWLLLMIGFVPWAALAAWVAWPLVLWPLRGHFAWPDAATGWIHIAETTGGLFVAMLVEEGVRKALERVKR